MIDIYDHNCVQTSENLAEYMRAHASRMERLYVIHNVMCGHAGTAPGYIWYAPTVESRLVQSVTQHPLNTSILIGWMLHLTVLALGGTKTGPTLYRIR